jgi:hypothetical protein
MYQPQIVNLTTSSPVFIGKGSLNQIIINSHSSGVIALANGTSSIINLVHSSMTIATGERYIPFNGEVFEDGLYAVLGGTINATFQYRLNS